MEHAARAGIPEAEYWDSSPRYVASRIRGQREVQQFQYEAGWEQSRLVAWATIASAPGKKKKTLHRPQDLVTFPWETTARARQLSEAEFAAKKAFLDAEAAKFFGKQ
jgi:hypothetical protein